MNRMHGVLCHICVHIAKLGQDNLLGLEEL